MALPTVTFENLAASAQANVPQTFAYVFAKGDVPAGSPLNLVAPNGALVPCQVDVHTTYSGGSVKHASLTATIPAIAASASVVYQIAIATSAPTGAAPVPADFPGLNAVVTLVDNGTDPSGPLPGTTYTANASARLAAGTYKTHRSGPFMAEWILRVPLVNSAGVEHPDLHARFEIMAYKGRSLARVHCIIENTWAKPKNPQPTTSGSSPWENVSTTPRVYSYSLSIAGTVVDARSVNGFVDIPLNYDPRGCYDSYATGIPNDSTVYNATMTIDGVAKPISLAGSSIQTYGQLATAIKAAIGPGANFSNSEMGYLGFRLRSLSTGAGSSVSVNYGTLFPALKQGTAQRPFRGDEYLHYPATGWMKTFWWGVEPTLHIRHDRAYMVASMAVPNYPASLIGSATRIATNKATMQANGDIGKNGMTKAFMGDTGYAPGIGVLPEWQAMYVINQGPDAKYVMLKQAALQLSWPMFLREYDTDAPVSFAKWPYATWSPNSGDSRNTATGLNEMLPPLTIPPHIFNNPNKPDIAHHPDFNFVPFMVTGDHFYMENLARHYAYLMLCLNPASTYRDGRRGLWIAESQTRGKGWLIRTSIHARFLLPDNHPTKVDVEYSVAQSLANFNSVYVDPNGPRNNIFGDFGGYLYSRTNGTNNANAPWQEDHATSAIGRAVELGYSEFLPLLAYKSRQVKGRLTSGPAFCWYLASNYTLQYRDTSTSPLYTSWAEVYSKGFSSAITSQACGSAGFAAAIGEKVGNMAGYPTDIGGFPANMQPAVAYCATFDMPGGDDAWLVFDSRAEKPDYNEGPQFSIVPRALSLAPSLPLVDMYLSSANRLGGSISDLPANGALFDTITVGTSPVKKYRCEYVRNNDRYATLYGGVLWLSSDTAAADSTVKVGLGVSGKSGTEPVLANDTVAPTGVTFSAAASKAAGIVLGDLLPGEWVAVWYECSIAAGAPADRVDSFTRTVEGFTK